MSLKEIDNDNATRDNVHTIYTNKSTERINQQQQARGIDKYANETNTIQTTR